MTMRVKLGLIAAAVALALAPFVLRDFYISLLNLIGIFSLVTLGLTMLIGWTGLISFGHAAFFGVGAYATAWLTTTQAISPWLGLVFGLVWTLGFALLFGGISLRLSGHYLSLATLAWGMGLSLLFGNLHSLGRQNGIPDIPAVSLLGFELDTVQKVYVLIWVCVGMAYAASMNLMWSRQGRAARILKDGIALGESFGMNAFWIRLVVFVFGALLASVAGWLYAHTFRYISPAPFGLMTGVEFLLMSVVGGMNSVVGALLGTGVLIMLRNVVQDILPLFTSYGGTLESIVFGIIFLVLLQRASGGLSDLYPSSLQPPASKLLPTMSRRKLPARGTEILRVEGLCKRFGGLTAVDDVSFSVSAGQVVGLIGPNGAGKSTTFNLITGLLKPTSGRIHVMGKNVAGLGPRKLFNFGVARTFQHVKINPQMTVLENVMVGAYTRTKAGFFSGALLLERKEHRAAMAEAMFQLRRVGLADKAGEFAGNLSLGQQRILEVARALCADPVLLMLDEPAAGLRHLEKTALAKLLSNLRDEGVSVLLVEHDMGFLMGLADRIVVLNFGTKLAEGSPGEVRTDPAVAEAYLGTS